MFTSTTEKKQCSSCTEVKFRPLGNRVLLKRLKAEEKLKGGLVLPDSAKESKKS
jgi:Co-chaperonin GroES (HSP10)